MSAPGPLDYFFFFFWMERIKQWYYQFVSDIAHWISLCLELNSLFWLKRFISNFCAPSGCDSVSSVWKFYFWWSPRIFPRCFNLKDDSVSTFMHTRPVLGEIPPPRTVDSCGSDIIDRQGFWEKIFLSGLFTTHILRNYNKQFKKDLTEFVFLFGLVLFSKGSWLWNFF